MEDRTIRCRYLRRGTKGQCTAEAVDADGEILLCTRHLADAIELVAFRQAQAATTGPLTAGSHQ